MSSGNISSEPRRCCSDCSDCDDGYYPAADVDVSAVPHHELLTNCSVTKVEVAMVVHPPPSLLPPTPAGVLPQPTPTRPPSTTSVFWQRDTDVERAKRLAYLAKVQAAEAAYAKDRLERARVEEEERLDRARVCVALADASAPKTKTSNQYDIPKLQMRTVLPPNTKFTIGELKQRFNSCCLNSIPNFRKYEITFMLYNRLSLTWNQYQLVKDCTRTLEITKIGYKWIHLIETYIAPSTNELDTNEQLFKYNKKVTIYEYNQLIKEQISIGVKCICYRTPIPSGYQANRRSDHRWWNKGIKQIN